MSIQTYSPLITSMRVYSCPSPPLKSLPSCNLSCTSSIPMLSCGCVPVSTHSDKIAAENCYGQCTSVASLTTDKNRKSICLNSIFLKGMPSVRIACLFSLGHSYSSPLKRFASSCAWLAFFRYLFVTLMSVCRAWSRATTIPSAFARSRIPESFKL